MDKNSPLPKGTAFGTTSPNIFSSNVLVNHVTFRVENLPKNDNLNTFEKMFQKKSAMLTGRVCRSQSAPASNFVEFLKLSN